MPIPTMLLAMPENVLVPSIVRVVADGVRNATVEASTKRNQPKRTNSCRAKPPGNPTAREDADVENDKRKKNDVCKLVYTVLLIIPHSNQSLVTRRYSRRPGISLSDAALQRQACLIRPFS